MHSQYLRVSQQQLSPLAVTHFLCFRSFSFFVDSREAKRTRGLCALHICAAIICAGTWTVIPAENDTSFSLVKPSLGAHHREQALRIHDIISLPGQAVHSVFPRTLRCFMVPLCEAETMGEKYERLVLICFYVEICFFKKKADSISTIFTDILFKGNGMVSPCVPTYSCM